MIPFRLLAALVLSIALGGCVRHSNWGESEIFDRTEEQIDLQYGMARMLERKQQLDRARSAYREIIDSDPDYGPALHRLGVVSMKLSDAERGIEYFARAVEQMDDSAELLADYGYALFLNGDPTGAILRLNAARELEPSDQRVINNLAIVIGSEGRAEESLELFRTVNSEANALCNLGFVLSQIGQDEDAKEYFHRALDLNPKLKKAENGLVRIQQNEDSSAEQRLAANSATGSNAERPEFESSDETSNRRGDVLQIVRQDGIKTTRLKSDETIRVNNATASATGDETVRR